MGLFFLYQSVILFRATVNSQAARFSIGSVTL